MLAEIARFQGELTAPQARVSTQVASSSTVDLDAQALRAAAATAAVAASTPAMSGNSISEISLAETVMMNQSAIHQTSGGALVTSPVKARPAPRRSRTSWALGGGALVLGAVAIAFIGATLQRSSTTLQTTVQEPEIKSILPVRARPEAALLPDAGVAVTAAVPGGPADAAPADASSGHEARPSPGPSPGTAPGTSTPATATARRVRSHIASADRARRAGNRLKQMAEADSALRLDPDSREAAYLFGDVLVHSDKARGCKHLRQARRLRKARQAFEAAGCGRTD
jgi:hypothetical protein